MIKPDWRDVETETTATTLDIPSLWANFMEFPREFDDDDSLVRAGSTAPEYVEPLFSPSHQSATTRKRGSRRHESATTVRCNRHGRGRRHDTGHRFTNWRGGSGPHRDRIHSVPA